ncbi:hypothetical protein ABIE88_000572 [Bradyrhizobium diazoefficiens]|uniref:hypothetical protein n=1 Tax=Bradyrhizobium diazoefficiens TaxID=1355477 RepID=UPI003514A718
MPRRGATITQADIARVLRAYRAEGVKVRVRLMPDGSTAFDPIEGDQKPTEADEAATAGAKEIVL